MATIVEQVRLHGYDYCTEKDAWLQLLQREGCKATIIAQVRLHGYIFEQGTVNLVVFAIILGVCVVRRTS